VLNTLNDVYFNEKSADNQKKLKEMIQLSSKDEGKIIIDF
jgi:hypothetical protein